MERFYEEQLQMPSDCHLSKLDLDASYLSPLNGFTERRRSVEQRQGCRSREAFVRSTATACQVATKRLVQDENALDHEFEQLTNVMTSFKWSADRLETLRDQLLSSNNESHEDAINDLYGMVTGSSGQVSVIASNIISTGLIPIILDTLKTWPHSDEAEINTKCKLAFVITNVAAGTTEQTSHVANAGAVAIMIDLIKSGVSILARQAIFTLCNIAGNLPCDRMVLMNSGVCPLLLMIARNSSTHSDKGRLAAWCMRNITTMPGVSYSDCNMMLRYFVSVIEIYAAHKMDGLPTVKESIIDESFQALSTAFKDSILPTNHTRGPFPLEIFHATFYMRLLSLLLHGALNSGSLDHCITLLWLLTEHTTVICDVPKMESIKLLDAIFQKGCRTLLVAERHRLLLSRVLMKLCTTTRGVPLDPMFLSEYLFLGSSVFLMESYANGRLQLSAGRPTHHSRDPEYILDAEVWNEIISGGANYGGLYIDKHESPLGHNIHRMHPIISTLLLWSVDRDKECTWTRELAGRAIIMILTMLKMDSPLYSTKMSVFPDGEPQLILGQVFVDEGVLRYLLAMVEFASRSESFLLETSILEAQEVFADGISGVAKNDDQTASIECDWLLQQFFNQAINGKSVAEHAMSLFINIKASLNDQYKNCFDHIWKKIDGDNKLIHCLCATPNTLHNDIWHNH